MHLPRHLSLVLLPLLFTGNLLTAQKNVEEEEKTPQQERAELREAFFKAERISDLGVKNNDFDDHFSELNEHILDEAPELIYPILKHADKLIRIEQEKLTWSSSSTRSWTPIANFLRNEITGRSANVVDGAAYLVRAFRDDEDSILTHWGSPYDYYRNGENMAKLINWSGGMYDASSSIRLLTNRLRERAGEGTTVFLTDSWFQMAENLRLHQIKSILNWCDQVESKNTDGDLEIATEIGHAFRFYLASRNDAPAQSLLQSVTSPDRWKQAYQDHIENADLTLNYRIALASSLSSTGIHILPDSMRLSMGRLTHKGLETDLEIRPENYEAVLEAFLRAPEPEEGWNEISKRLYLAWERRNRFNGMNSKSGKAWSPSTTSYIPLIKLAIRGKNDEALERLTPKSHLYSQSLWLATITECIINRNFEFAENTLKLRGTENRPYSIAFYAPYTAQLEKNLPAFLDSIDEAQWKTYAEVMLKSLEPEPLDGTRRFSKTSTPTTIHDRLPPLVNKVANTNFEDPDLADRTLEFLSLAGHKIVPPESLIKPKRKMLGVEIGSITSSGLVKWLMFAAYADIYHQYAAGDHAIIIAALDEMKDLPYERSYYHSYAVDTIAERVSEILIDLINHNKRSELKELLPGTRKIAERIAADAHSNDAQILFQSLLFAHLWTKQMPAWNDWLANMTKEVKSEVNGVGWGTALGTPLPPLFPKHFTPQERIDLWAAYLNYPSFRESRANHPESWLAILNKVLTPDEVTDLIKILNSPDQNTPHAADTIELARITAAQNDLETATTLIDNARFSDTLTISEEVTLNIEFANLLIAKGQLNEAYTLASAQKNRVTSRNFKYNEHLTILLFFLEKHLNIAPDQQASNSLEPITDDLEIQLTGTENFLQYGAPIQLP